jgi:hypothetical protein
VISQVGVWVPETRNVEGTHHLIVRNLVSSATQADGINLHGQVHSASVQNAYIATTGDDNFAVWGGNHAPEHITFTDCVAVDPGILRPGGWYGACVATYGVLEVSFERTTCVSRTFTQPLPFPKRWGGANDTRGDNSMFTFYESFGAVYPPQNQITIRGWVYEDFGGQAYQPTKGVVNGNPRLSGKKAWSRRGATVAPYYVPSAQQASTRVNVLVEQPSGDL